jgi:aerobic carbon-monoxide dehydrogenase medium subunit
LKPAPFEYQAPTTLQEAAALLAADPEAVLIAGGQSLMPVLAFRLATPSALIDLRRVAGLDTITIDDAGIRLGARVRWVDIERDFRLAQVHPLLQEAVAHVAHYQIRNRGTVGGSLAHADPAAELPGIAVTCGGAITLVSEVGSRIVPSAEFFTGPLTTVCRPNEIVTELHLPPWPPGRRWAFQEFAQREGDFALAGVALFYDGVAEGRIAEPHIGVIGACQQPHRLEAVEKLLDGNVLTEELIGEAAEIAARSVDPPQDMHAGIAYRRGLIRTLVERGLRAAIARGK